MALTSPDGRFRFVKDAQGAATATAYDTVNGLLVGWNVLDLKGMTSEERQAARMIVDLLKGLQHSHVLGVHSSWVRRHLSELRSCVDAEGLTKISAHLIRDQCLPPMLNDFTANASLDIPNVGGDHMRRRQTLAKSSKGVCCHGKDVAGLEEQVAGENTVELLRWRVVKRWCRQVLEALSFLHGQPTPIVHRELGLGNVYIDPSTSHLFVGGVKDIVTPTMMPSLHGSSLRSTGTGRSEQSSRARPVGDPRDGKGGFRSSGGGVGGANTAAAREGAEGRGRGGEFLEQKRTAGLGDVRACGTLLIEMILMERLDPVKARDESWIEKLLLVSGWPACVMDFIRACRAPIDERPTAAELLEHPFLELDNDLDDEPVLNDTERIVMDIAAVPNVNVGAGLGATGTANRCASRRAGPPPPLVAPVASRHTKSYRPRGAGATRGGFVVVGAESYFCHRNLMQWSAGTPENDQYCPAWTGSAGWSGLPSSPAYTPSCVSTDSPSPSSVSAAMSFDGAPGTPSSPLRKSTGSDIDWAHAGAMPSSGVEAGVGEEEGEGEGGDDAEYNHGYGNAEHFLSEDVGLAAYGPRTKMVAAGPGRSTGQGRFDPQGRIRAVSYSAHDSSLTGRNSRMIEGGNGHEELGVDGTRGCGTSAGRVRSASEDAVWDLLPSDERECRRPHAYRTLERRWMNTK